MAVPVVLGADDQSVYLRFLDSTTFLEETGITAATGGLTLSYKKGFTGTSVSVTSPTITTLAAETTAHTDWGIKHCADGTVRVDLPDAAIPTIENEVTLVSGSATGMIVLQAALVGVQAIGAPAGASVSADVAAVQADTNDLQGRIPAALTGAGNIKADALVLTGALTTYTGNTPQTGDSFARIGAAGAGLTAVGDTAGTTTLLTRITALLQTKAEADTAHGLLATAAKMLSYFQSALRSNVTVDPDIGGTYDDAAHSQQALAAASAPSAATIADAVWDEALAGHVGAGSAGAALSTAGAAADPLLNAVPGAYGAGTAGYVLGLINAGRISVTFTGPVLSAGSMEIVPGDDYHETEGVDAVWTWTDAVASYTTATATFYAEREGSTDFSKALYSIAKSGSTVTAKMRLTAAESVLLTSGAPWKFQLRVAWGTTPARSTTKLSGLLGIVDRVGT